MHVSLSELVHVHVRVCVFVYVHMCLCLSVFMCPWLMQVAAPAVMGTFGLVRVFVVSPTLTLASTPVQFTVEAPTVTAVSPNLIDARGQSITIYGSNFGYATPDNVPIVFLGQRPCLNAALVVPSGSATSQPVITCVNQDDVAGPKNVSITIAYQTVVVPATASHTATQCFAGYFGGVGQFCDPCPEGAVCTGALNDFSAPGWYNVSYNGRQGCTPRHTGAAVCWEPLPCVPPDSCVGNNTCAPAYADPHPMLR